jgi:hypothetical protein
LGLAVHQSAIKMPRGRRLTYCFYFHFDIVMASSLTTHKLVASSSAALEIARTNIIAPLGIEHATTEEIDTTYLNTYATARFQSGEINKSLQPGRNGENLMIRAKNEPWPSSGTSILAYPYRTGMKTHLV